MVSPYLPFIDFLLSFHISLGQRLGNWDSSASSKL